MFGSFHISQYPQFLVDLFNALCAIGMCSAGAQVVMQLGKVLGVQLKHA